MSELRLTPLLRAVLDALAGERKRAVRDIARDSGYAPSTVRTALARLGKAGYVQHVYQRDVPDRAPHTVYWPTPAGRRVSSHAPGG